MASPPPISGLPATSSPAPASTTARWRRRAPFRWRRRSRGASPISTGSMRSARSRSTSPAASMPAAIIMSAISASSASIRRARSSTRSRSAARRARAPRSAPSWGRALPAMRCRRPSRRSSTPISACASTARNLSRRLSQAWTAAVQGGPLCRSSKVIASSTDSWIRVDGRCRAPRVGRHPGPVRAAAAELGRDRPSSRPVGVVFPNTERAEALQSFLGRLSLIVLPFPGLHRRSRLFDRPPAARSRFCRRIACGRQRAPRSAAVHAPGRLRCFRGARPLS